METTINIKTHGAYIITVNANMDILAIVRYHCTPEQAKDWGKENEETVLKSADGVTDFIERCLKNKKEVFACLKSVESQKTEQS